jgi:hypothetical protein
MTFEIALTRWHKAERARIDLHLAYERAYATALIHADGKSDSIRKAQADLAAADDLHAYEHAAAEAKAAEHLVLHLRKDAA